MTRILVEYSSTASTARKSDAMERLACGEPFHGDADDDDANVHAY